MTTPPVPYYGGKTNLAPRIAALFPKHSHYVEPYCGGLSVLLAKGRSANETVNDLDGDLMTFWRVLRDQPDELARLCALTPHSRAEHATCSAWLRAEDREEVAAVEVARRVWVCLTQGRAAVLSNTPGWRHFVKPGYTSFPDYLAGYIGRIHAAADRIHDVSLESMPALDLIAKYGRDPDVLLYVDPPYLGSTRDGGSGGYRNEMRDDARHGDLAAALLDCRASVVLSGYASPLYDSLYAGWSRSELAASTGQGDVFANRTEVLWSNRPLAEPHLFSEETA